MTAPPEREQIFAIAAARVATPTELLSDGFVIVGGGSVLAVGQGAPPEGVTVVDLGDVLIVPGFVDLHVHGGGGAQVNCPTREEVAASVWRMARFHATHGTTAMVATTVSDSPEALQAAVEGVAMVTHGEAVPDAEPLPARETGAHAEAGATGRLGPRRVGLPSRRGRLSGAQLSSVATSRGRGSPAPGPGPVPRRLAPSLCRRARRPRRPR